MNGRGARGVWALRGGKSLDLSQEGPGCILGILNVTPDSFSDGGKWTALDAAVAQAERMIAEGAAGIDVGGESTRPGAVRVSASEQVRRVVPVIEAVRRRLGDGPVITVDTTLAEVAQAALNAGADGVNDVSGGTEDGGLLGVVAASGCGVVLMHRKTTPERDVYSTQYAAAAAEGDVVAEVRGALAGYAAAAVAAGVRAGCIVLDPGLGFGKTVEQNLELIRKTGEFVALGWPVMSGLSRKSFTCRPSGLPDSTPPAQRIDATVALSLAHRRAGARLFRVHDVAEHVRAFTLQGAGGG